MITSTLISKRVGGLDTLIIEVIDTSRHKARTYMFPNNEVAIEEIIEKRDELSHQLEEEEQ